MNLAAAIANEGRRARMRSLMGHKQALHWLIEHPMEEVKDSLGFRYRYNDTHLYPRMEVYIPSGGEFHPSLDLLAKGRKYERVPRPTKEIGTDAKEIGK